jgi:hypothetical protein
LLLEFSNLLFDYPSTPITFYYEMNNLKSFVLMVLLYKEIIE